MTKPTTKIIRYSTHGFKPQYHSHHQQDINYRLHNFNINDFLDNSRYIIQKQREKHLLYTKQIIKISNMEYGSS